MLSNETVKTLKEWIKNGGNPDLRSDFHAASNDEMSDVEHKDMLDSLAVQTKSRIHPEGHREFLLHRGAHKSQHDIEDGKMDHWETASWTPHSHVAHEHATHYHETEPSHVISAWVPEHNISGYVPHLADSYGIKLPKKFHREHEVIVGGGAGFDVDRTVDRPEIHESNPRLEKQEDSKPNWDQFKDEVPQVYHATYASQVPSIMKHGLGHKDHAKPNWDFSEKGKTYFAQDPDVAESFADTAERPAHVPHNDKIVVLKVPTSALKNKHLGIDQNNRVDDHLGDEHLTITHSSPIHPKHIEIHNPKLAEGRMKERAIEALEKMSRPSIKFPNFKDTSTRPDQNVQPIETARQKEIFGRKVANEQLAHIKPGAQFRLSGSRKSHDKSSGLDAMGKRISSRFDRNTLGMSYGTKTGPPVAGALAGKMRSKFEEGDEGYQKKLAEHKEKSVAARTEHREKFNEWYNKAMSLHSQYGSATGDDRQTAARELDAHIKQKPKLKLPRTPSKPKVDTADLSADQQAKRGKAVDSTIHHEGFHNTMRELETHYGKPAAEHIQEGLLSHHDKAALGAVGDFIHKKLNYDPRSPSFKEEILAHSRDILVNPKKRESFMNHVGEDGKKHIDALKRGHQKAYAWAKNLKPTDVKKTEADVVGTEGLEKGLKEIGLAAAIAATPTLASPSIQETQAVPKMAQPASHIEHLKAPANISLEGDLRHIATIESSGGKNKAHAQTTVGLNRGQTAGGSTGLMPIMVKEIISKNPELKAKYGHLLAYPHDKVTSEINGNDNMDHEIANAHWKRLEHTFEGDRARMAYAWRKGITAAKNASDDAVLSHPYVQKFMTLSAPQMAMSKSEELRARFQDLTKGANGDHEKEGYKLTAQHHDNHPIYGDKCLEVKCHHPVHGEVGSSILRPQADGTWEPTNTMVHKDHRRKGIAKAMYSRAGQELEKDIAPSATQTSSSKALWSSMGKSEEMDLDKTMSVGHAIPDAGAVGATALKSEQPDLKSRIKAAVKKRKK